jgi:hypothetical protein
MSFSNMKKSSGNTESLMEELNKISTNDKASYQDDRFWKIERDKSDNGFAVIRFLPPVDGEDAPWVRMFSHGFKGKGGWYIENCPTTIGRKCPLCEANSELWNSGLESDKDIARQRKRRLNYISNIMVVSDPKNPENEGKVFLYKFGKKIFDKIMESLQPEFEDENPVNPFDFWKGANFKLKVRKVAGFINYDKSEFDSPSELLDGDDSKLEELWNKQYPLQPLIAEDQFKSYDELKGRLMQVLGRGGNIAETAEEVATTTTKEEVAETVKNQIEEATKSDSGNEEEDALAYFERLANED